MGSVRTRLLLYLLGWTAMVDGAALILPVPVSVADDDGLCWIFAFSAATLLALGGFAAWKGREHPERLLVREGACFLVGAWILLTVTAAMPYLLTGTLSVADAWAEGVSGVTTTGLTLLAADAPRSLICDASRPAGEPAFVVDAADFSTCNGGICRSNGGGGSGFLGIGAVGI